MYSVEGVLLHQYYDNVQALGAIQTGVGLVPGTIIVIIDLCSSLASRDTYSRVGLSMVPTRRLKIDQSH